SKTLLKATALKGTTTDYALAEINNMLAEEIPSDMFITIFYGILDTRTGAFEYTNAGHCHPYMLTADGKICQFEKVGGLLIGAIKDAQYESDTIQLQPDDSLFFYTDGVTEAFNTIKEEEFNEKRLFETLQNNHRISCETIVDNVVSNVRVFTDGIEQSDDITCMALRYMRP
ncbi:MAG: PP2C family protein-serine/threonine phosphatase, partial [Syntrophothermus sp.]